MKVVVLAGGLSPERDVSLSSGAMVANALMTKGHQVLVLDVYEGCPDCPDFETAFNLKHQAVYTYEVPETPPDLVEIAKESHNGEALIGPNVLKICQSADVAFLALHGAMGENGQIQATLDVHGIAYTGSGYAGSLLAMDKVLSKQLMEAYGVRSPKWLEVNLERDVLAEIEGKVTLPCVIKPVSGGSSIGVSLVRTKAEWQAAIELARAVESTLLIEELIIGREFSVGVLGGKALPVIEIMPAEGFYDYKNKYQAGLTKEICPALIQPILADKLREEAVKVHHLLRLGAYSRVDFLVTKAGETYCLEANTLPGMTPTSLLPQEAAAAGIDYPELCDSLIHLSLGSSRH